MISFSTDMQTEKIAAIVLVIIIAGALSVWIGVTYGEDILSNLFGEEEKVETIALGDCVDVHYIGCYASNDTVFDTSYEDVENKAGGTPLNVYVSLNKTAMPLDDYPDYVSSILVLMFTGQDHYPYEYSPLAVVEGFIESLIGLKDGETKTTEVFSPEEGFGVDLEVGDVVNLTPYVGITFELKIVEIHEDEPVPSEYDFLKEYYNIGNNTTLFVLKENWHKKGDTTSKYLAWENSTFVTKINETTMWVYTDPPDDKLENFTWTNETTGMNYGENASSVTTINDTTIIVKHSPEINSTIELSGFYGVTVFTVENMTEDKINISYTDDYTGNISYIELNRKTVIQRNETQSIVTPLSQFLGIDNPLIPGELAESLFQTVRLDPLGLDSTFKGSCNRLSGESVYFELEIVNVYKTSQTES